MPESDYRPSPEVPSPREDSTKNVNGLNQYKPCVKALGRFFGKKVLSYVDEEVILHSDFQKRIEWIRLDQTEWGNVVRLLREAGYLEAVDGQRWKVRKE